MTAFKKFEVIWSPEGDHITSNFLKAVFHNFTWSIFEYFVPNNPIYRDFLTLRE